MPVASGQPRWPGRGRQLWLRALGIRVARRRGRPVGPAWATGCGGGVGS